MKTRRIHRFASALAGVVMTLGLTASPRADVQIDARIQIHPRPTEDLQIWVWPDRGEGSSYTIGDPISMNVEVSRDCFLILYNIDTRGNLRILFPYDPWDDNFVSAGDVIRFPRSGDGYDWTVDGPPGTEYVQAIATEFPIAPPDWPVYMRSVIRGVAVSGDPELYDFHAGPERLDYIRVINRKIAGRYWDWCATDLATFAVRHPNYRRVNFDDDRWPDVFYGDIYIGWPVGQRIYIDNVFIGIAPLWVPRHYYGHHVITCYRGSRLLRRHAFDFHPKRDYWYQAGPYRSDILPGHGYVKSARRGGDEQFRDQVERYKTEKRSHRQQQGREQDDQRKGRSDRTREWQGTPNTEQRHDEQTHSERSPENRTVARHSGDVTAMSGTSANGQTESQRQIREERVQTDVSQDGSMYRKESNRNRSGQVAEGLSRPVVEKDGTTHESPPAIRHRAEKSGQESTQTDLKRADSNSSARIKKTATDHVSRTSLGRARAPKQKAETVHKKRL